MDIVGIPPRRAIVEGSRGSEVSDVQRALKASGDYAGPISGVYTPELTRAVEEFQRSHGLRVDGVVHRSTYEALGLYPPKRVDPPWLEKATKPPVEREAPTTPSNGRPVLLARFPLAQHGAPASGSRA